MRSLPLALAALLALPFAPASASAAAAEPGWRIAACVRASDSDGSIVGNGSIVFRRTTRVAELPGVKLTSERLDFAGAKCELLYISGDIPAGSESGYEVIYNTYADLVLDGTPRGETESEETFGSSTNLYAFSESSVGNPSPRNLLAAIAYPPTESGVFPTDPSIPPEWQGKPYTSTYTRSAWDVALVGGALAKKSFKRNDATDRSARTASTRDIAAAKATYADEVADIKRDSSLTGPAKKVALAQAKRTESSAIALARKRLRLALKGTKLVLRNFQNTYGGALLP